MAEVDHWPVLVFVAARQAHAAKEDIAELLGRTDIEAFADGSIDFFFDPRRRLRQFARQSRQDLAVDADAALFHAGDDVDQWPFEPLVDRCEALGGEARLQQPPQPQRHVGVLGGIMGRLVERHGIEGDPRAPRTGDILEGDRFVPKEFLGQLVHAVIAAPGVEHVADQQGIVEGGDGDAALGKDQPVIFQVLGDLEDRGILEHRLEQRERLLLGTWPSINPPPSKSPAPFLWASGI